MAPAATPAVSTTPLLAPPNAASPTNGLAGTAAATAGRSGAVGTAAVTGDDLVIVAVADRPMPRPGAGATPRAEYRQGRHYSGSDSALEAAATLAADNDLTAVLAWTIQPLNWRCMLYRLRAGDDRAAVLARLSADPRVVLAQRLNRFDTLTTAVGAATPAGARPAVPAAAPAAAATTPGAGDPGRATAIGYNDPYLPLQSGFAAIDAAGAQRVSRGERVTIAVIDTGIDTSHPDLQGRVLATQDFVGRPAAGEHHGTQVAGVIAAAANNGMGIVGVAPAARLLPLRACWAEAGSDGARCNSLTLARALAAAIAAGADVINLSLGGPRDALLERLTLHALDRGIVVVGAMPGARRDGFPSALPGVLAVASGEDGPPDSGVLAAPGRRILTLAPGGGYDYASGSSLASAHVSGAAALLRAIDSRLRAPAVERLLRGADDGGSERIGAVIDACRAVQRLRGATVCNAPRP